MNKRKFYTAQRVLLFVIRIFTKMIFLNNKMEICLIKLLYENYFMENYFAKKKNYKALIKLLLLFCIFNIFAATDNFIINII